MPRLDGLPSSARERPGEVKRSRRRRRGWRPVAGGCSRRGIHGLRLEVLRLHPDPDRLRPRADQVPPRLRDRGTDEPHDDEHEELLVVLSMPPAEEESLVDFL